MLILRYILPVSVFARSSGIPGPEGGGFAGCKLVDGPLRAQVGVVDGSRRPGRMEHPEAVAIVKAAADEVLSTEVFLELFHRLLRLLLHLK